MRNLEQYPITVDQIRLALGRALNKALEEESIGDPLCLHMAIRIVDAANEMRHAINKKFDENPPPFKWVTPWGEAAKLNDAFDGSKL